jgi:hypothetical protein
MNCSLDNFYLPFFHTYSNNGTQSIQNYTLKMVYILFLFWTTEGVKCALTLFAGNLKSWSCKVTDINLISVSMKNSAHTSSGDDVITSRLNFPVHPFNDPEICDLLASMAIWFFNYIAEKSCRFYDFRFDFLLFLQNKFMVFWFSDTFSTSKRLIALHWIWNFYSVVHSTPAVWPSTFCRRQ